MALTGMQVYKSLPKDHANCGDCGFPTCMAFAMQVAAKQKAMTDCPHLSDDAKSEMADASAPPMKLVHIGPAGEAGVEIGQETVMFRHEEKFHKQPALAATIPATLSDEDAAARIAQINDAVFTRVGQTIEVRLAAIEGASSRLTGNERVLAEAIGGGRPFPEVCQMLGFDRESAARSIQLLRLVGAVKLVRIRARDGFLGESDLERHDDEQLRTLVVDLVKLIGALVMHLSHAEGGPDGIRDRLGRVTDEAAGRFPALLSGLALFSESGPDPEPLIDRALKLPGNREEQVTMALGELVSYLEFEIKNHPGIENPDEILAGLAEARATAG